MKTNLKEDASLKQVRSAKAVVRRALGESVPGGALDAVHRRVLKGWRGRKFNYVPYPETSGSTTQRFVAEKWADYKTRSKKRSGGRG